jgi:hypothetical protein
MKSPVQQYIEKIEANYQRVVVALKETIRLMVEVDQTIPGWPME